jgi:zinc D-Ala-D-Ala carboxypeptidase
MAPGRASGTGPASVRLGAGRRSIPALLLVFALLVGASASGALASGAQPAVAVVPTVPPVSTKTTPPACRIADKTTKYTRTSLWFRTQLDWTLRLPATYHPPDLVSVSQAGLSGGGSVRRIALADLKQMVAAARRAGARLAVESAYRSYNTQISTFGYWVARAGFGRAIYGSARPGHSEHQLGTVIDFKTAGGGVPWAFDWATTRAGAWMAKNAWKYGWVMSYPKGKQPSTCYNYEPWHYRYYGKTIAAAIHATGQTTRVWLWRHGNSPGWVDPTPTPSPSASASESPSPSPSMSADPTPVVPAVADPGPSGPSPTPSPTPLGR